MRALLSCRSLTARQVWRSKCASSWTQRRMLATQAQADTGWRSLPNRRLPPSFPTQTLFCICQMFIRFVELLNYGLILRVHLEKPLQMERFGNPLLVDGTFFRPKLVPSFDFLSRCFKGRRVLGTEPTPEDLQRFRSRETQLAEMGFSLAGKQAGQNYQIVYGPVVHCELPDAALLICVMCNDAAPISQKSGIGQFCKVTEWGGQRIACRRIPYPRRFISTGRYKPFAIGTKRCCADLSLVFNRGNEPLSCRRIPFHSRGVLARSDNAAAIGAEGSEQDSIPMLQMGTDWATVARAPHLGVAFRQQ